MTINLFSNPSRVSKHQLPECKVVSSSNNWTVENSKKQLGIFSIVGLTVTTASITTLICVTILKPLSISQVSNVTNKASLSSTQFYPLKAVSASGYIEPQGEVIQVHSSVQTAKVEQLLVQQGDQIKAGQIIAILDTKDRLETALKLAEQQVNIAQAKLDQVKAGTEIGYLKAQSAIVEQLQSELTGKITAKQANIERLNVQLIGEKKSQQATINRLKAELNHADRECQRYQTLYNNGAVSSSLHDSKCLEKQTLLQQLNEANSHLEKTVRSLEKEMSEAKADLTRTRNTLQQQIINANQTYQAMGEVRDVDIHLAEAELQSAKVAVDHAKANLATAYVKSPKTGQILKVNTQQGELVSSQGIVELGQTSQMYVVAEVYETDIASVRVGQVATIESDGLAKTLKGTVEKIGLQIGKKDVLGTDPAADADARVVEVKIRLNAADSQQVAGLTNLAVDVIIDQSVASIH